MRKLFAIALLLAVVVSVSAQVRGFDTSEAIHINQITSIDEGYIYDLGGDYKNYVMPFDYTVVGYKHSYEKLNELLRANNLYFDEPAQDKTLFPSYADSFTDYNSIHTACSVGSAEILIKWDLPNGWCIAWTVNDEVNGIQVWWDHTPINL